jgi:hypothetical protein
VVSSRSTIIRTALLTFLVPDRHESSTISHRMNPRIVAISGPLENSVFPLDDSDLIIGRGKKSHVRLDDPRVSPRHCSLEYSNERCLLVALENVYGTFVNGFYVGGKVLVEGDHVRVGRSVFVYLYSEEFDQALLSLTDTEKIWNRSMERVAIYEAATITALQAFLRFTASINAIASADGIQARVVEFIFQVIPVERVAILLAGHDQDVFDASHAWRPTRSLVRLRDLCGVTRRVARPDQACPWPPHQIGLDLLCRPDGSARIHSAGR